MGTTAKPQCAITQASGAQSCVLVCTPSDSSDAQCGTGASCKAIQGIGICTYDDDHGRAISRQRSVAVLGTASWAAIAIKRDESKLKKSGF